MQDLCVKLCDQDAGIATSAARSLKDLLDKSCPREIARGFDHIFAPIFARLAEPSLSSALLEALLVTLASLLARADVGEVKQARACRIFPMTLERVLTLLETKAANVNAMQAEEVTIAALSVAEVALSKWYSLCDRSVEVIQFQIGFLTHISLQLVEGGNRELCPKGLAVLLAVPSVECCADRLACFYPGVCTGVVKLLLHGDFKLGSKIVVAAVKVWHEWIRRVLSDAANQRHFKSTVPLTLAGLFGEYNKSILKYDSQVEAFAPTKQANPKRDSKLAVERDSEWLAEAGANTSEALCTVLQIPRSPLSAVWDEKASVRHSITELSAAILEECRNTLTGKLLDSCFDILLSALSDVSEENRAYARQCLSKYANCDTDEPLQKRLMDRVTFLIKAVHPPTGSKFESRVSLKQRIARCDGLLCFLREYQSANMNSGQSFFRLPTHHAEFVLQPVLRLFAVDPTNLQQTFQDTRPLASLPISSISESQLLIEQFPYNFGNVESNDMASSSREHQESKWRSELDRGDAYQIDDWLCRSLRLADGDLDLASHLKDMISHLPGVFDITTLFTLIFDDTSCSWSHQANPHHGVEPFPLSPTLSTSTTDLAKKSILRKATSMFVMSVWLDAGRRHNLDIPKWVVVHCITLSLSSGEVHPGDAMRTLCDVCALYLLLNALMSLKSLSQHASPHIKSEVHLQVKHILIPLLEHLGASSFASSFTASVVLVRLHSILEAEGHCHACPAGCGEVQVLLSSYADYLVGDICFHLKFDDAYSRECRGGMPAVLVAVVQHVGLEMVPFLTDVVGALLKRSSCSAEVVLNRHGVPDGWELRVLASVVRQLARLICEARFRKRGTTVNDEASDLSSSMSAFAGILSGARREWKATKRRDGFFVNDLEHCLDEDAAQDPHPDQDKVEAPPSTSCYDAERNIATDVALFSRHYMRSSCASTRHLAHVTVLHSLTVLSTRIKDLLPRVHDIWSSLQPSFSSDQPLAVQADACTLLKHIARISGDFVRERFASECWPGIWCQLKDTTVAKSDDASARLPKFKAQIAMLDCLAFLAGDSSVIAPVLEQLVVIGLKFLCSVAASNLQAKALSLINTIVVEEPDLVWLYLQGLSHEGLIEETDAETEATIDVDSDRSLLDLSEAALNVDLPLLQEAALGAISKQTCKRLLRQIEITDGGLKPRVDLSLGGQLWLSYLSS